MYDLRPSLVSPRKREESENGAEKKHILPLNLKKPISRDPLCGISKLVFLLRFFCFGIQGWSRANFSSRFVTRFYRGEA